jgi:hypothetical protein
MAGIYNVLFKMFFSISGNASPRRSALLKIPCLAFRLKKYLPGTSASKIADKEDTTATLGDSPVLGIQDAPGQRLAIPP